MIDKIRGRGGRFASVAVSALTLFALVLVASPAKADATSAENFWPDGTTNAGATTSGTAMNITTDTNFTMASDKPDGAGTTMHATTVTTLDAQVVEYWWCNTYPAHQAGAGGDAADPSDPGGTGGTFGCTQVGTDTSGTPGGPGAEYYEAQVDVPTAYEDLAVAFTPDFVAYVCDNPVTDDTACDAEVEGGFPTDDSTGAAADSSSGEITSPAHGSAVSNAGFTASVTTSADVTSITGCLAYDTVDTDPADEGQDSVGDGDPQSCDVIDTDGAPDSTTGTASKTWSLSFAAGEVDDNTEFALLVAEGMDDDLDDPDLILGDPTVVSGAGFCAGETQDCGLDQHALYSQAIQATSVALALTDAEPDPTKNECHEVGHPTTADVSANNSGLHMTGCIFDQNGNLVTDLFHYAWQVTPDDPAGNASDSRGLDDAHDSENNDPDLDDFFEQMDGDPSNADNEGFGPALAFDGIDLTTLGTYTVMFCYDQDNNAEDLAIPQSSTPCSGEALSATATINIVQPIDHVHVKKSGTEGPLCHTGSSTTVAPAGSTVNLTGCALGTNNANVEQGSAGNHVLWLVNPAGNPDDPGQVATQENLTDSAGKADAAISSGPNAADKTTTIRFCLDEFPFTTDGGNGICDSLEDTGMRGGGVNPALQADFQINWQKGAGPDTSAACAKVKAKIRNLKQKIREAKKAGDQAKVRRLRAALRRAKARRARVC